MSRILFAFVSVLASGLAYEASAQQSAEEGARVFKQACAACHSTDPGVHMTGPSLADVWGRRAGTVETFPRYSPALVSAAVEWNNITLDAWLSNPAAFVPGNHMPFEGLADPTARLNVSELLRGLAQGNLTQTAQDILRRPGMMEPQFQDLKELGPAHQVTVVRYCRDTFHVTTADGDVVSIWEFNLRFSSDSSRYAPLPGHPVIVLSGMMGDRAHIFFADPAEISAFIQQSC